MPPSRPEDEDVLNRAVKHFGADTQIEKAIEEMGELTVALIKYRHGRATKEQVIDEVADVFVTSGSLMVIFGEQAVRDRVDFKLHRLWNRILGANDGK